VSKLSLQWIRMPEWAKEVAPRLRCVKLVDPPSTPPWGDLQYIIRTPDVDALQNRFIHLGADGADAWWLTYGPFFRARSWAHAIEIGNEPDTSESALPAWVAFTRRAVQLVHEAGLRAVVGNFARGTPQLRAADANSRAWWIIAPALDGADYLGLHEYGFPDMMRDHAWHTLRHRFVAQELAGIGVAMPPTLITECGIDGGDRQGWKAFTDGTEHYLDQLAWYDAQLSQDEYIKAAFLYTSGPTWDWESFDVTETIARAVAAWGGVSLVSTPPIIAESRNIPPESKTTPWRALYIHHTGIDAPFYGQPSVDATITYWKGRGWDAWPHWIVGPDGSTWPTFDISKDGIGVSGHNAGARHIEMWGLFTDHTPPVTQWDATATLAARLLYDAGLDERALRMHREDERTECPGQAFAQEWPWFVADVGSALDALRDEDAAPLGDPDHPITPVSLLCEKARWQWEQTVRELEAGDTATALARARTCAAWLGEAERYYKEARHA